MDGVVEREEEEQVRGERGGEELWLHEKPASSAAGRRRPPKVLPSGPLASIFGEWLAVAPHRADVGLFGPQRDTYRALWRRIAALAPPDWHPHAFRRGAAHELEQDPDLSPEDLRDLLGHADFKTTQLYLATSTAAGHRQVSRQVRRLQPPEMRLALAPLRQRGR